MQTLNKKASFNYILQEKHEAGIILTGGEAKAIRNGKADLSNSYAKIMEDEVFLINVNIPIEGKKDYQPTRSRKLLLHRSEITAIKSKIKAQNLTLVPTKLYTKGALIKAEIALAKGKRKFEKKEAIKRKDIQRDLERELRVKD